ncbi:MULTISPECIES: VOC family protein [unclassified Pseudofrankia]|uniref:VOC family protein n=1 Tax=unclassified Pseudofrankia TaxID=2994372 RepID=UPI0008DA1915|nr:MULTISPECIES: VOC family protein [unclassified Pseudofrankia]MDT3439396.1 VOC family protein [Pseudofrankia sp. BMG5.37]OHV65020.1 glyoxalase [Pseudofrankia sp. BMG5.36]
MAEFTSYEPGTPCWVDLGSPDVEASRAFYGSLFGWEANVSPDPAAGGYTLFTLRGKQVAGLGPLFGEGQPAAWSTYVRVDDADKTAEAVVSAGGQVVVAPMDVLDAGRMAVFLDSGGAAISVWQPGAHKGAELANEPGAFCWNELDTRDVAAAKAFYPAVFGWATDDSGAQGGPMEYYEWKLGGAVIGGMMPMPEMVPAEVPSFWMTYFAVADADAVAAKTVELGGSVILGPADIPIGRFAILTGPHQETFAIIKV